MDLLLALILCGFVYGWAVRYKMIRLDLRRLRQRRRRSVGVLRFKGKVY